MLTCVLYHITKLRFSHYLLSYGFLCVIMTHTSLTALYPALLQYKLYVYVAYTIPIVAGLLLDRLLYKDGSVYIDNFIVLIALFYLACIISGLLNISTFDTTIHHLTIALLPSLTAFAIVQTLNQKHLETLALLFVSFIFLNVLISLTQIKIHGLSLQDTIKISGFFTNRNMFSRALTIAHAFFLIKMLAYPRPTSIKKTLYFVLLVFIFVNLLVLYSRSGYLLYVIISSIIIYLIGTKKTKIYYSFFGMIIIVIFAILTMQRFSHSGSGTINFSDIGRIATYKAGINMVIHNPLFGIGFGTHRNSEKFEHYMDKDQVGLESVQTIHNDFLAIAAETGLIGVSFYILFNLGIIIKLFSSIKQRTLNQRRIHHMQVFVFAWVLSIAISELFQPPAYDRGIYWLGIAMALVLLRSNHTQTTTSIIRRD